MRRGGLYLSRQPLGAPLRPIACSASPAARTAEAAAGDMLLSSPASIKRHVEERISARHRERAATLALATVVHESPEVASKLVSLQKGRAAQLPKNFDIL